MLLVTIPSIPHNEARIEPLCESIITRRCSNSSVAFNTGTRKAMGRSLSSPIQN